MIVIGHLKNRCKILNQKTGRNVLQGIMWSVPWQKARPAKSPSALSSADLRGSTTPHCGAALL